MRRSLLMISRMACGASLAAIRSWSFRMNGDKALRSSEILNKVTFTNLKVDLIALRPQAALVS